MTSKIKVDNINKVSDDSNIIKKCGTTTTIGSGASNPIVVDGSAVTIGRCGGTVALASGASQTGFGREGSVNWQTTIKTGDFTAVSGEGYFVDTTSGEIDVTLPSSPSAGDIVAVSDYAKTFDTNNCIMLRNSSNIEGAASNLTLDAEGLAMTFVYADATKGWKVVGAGREADKSSKEFIEATGGNSCATVGDYKVHIFTSPGTFCVSKVGNVGGSNSVTATVIGGAAGGGNRHGGGGGAGGVAIGQGIPISVQGYPISVGGGGGGSSSPGSRSSAGTNSTGISFTGVGGGPAGSQGPNTPGLPGGSGGGSAVGGVGGCSGPAPAGSATQPGQSQPPVVAFNGGSNGGQGGTNPGPDDGGGGGGGAGGAGIPSSPSNPNFSNGGAGKDITPFINAAPAYPLSIYAGGGGGGANNNPAGGQGGDNPSAPLRGGAGPGGNSGVGGNAGSANTGGGGGASGSAPTSGGNGGSGIVIIEYKFQ